MIDFQPAFFSWGNAQNEGMGFPPLPSFLGIPAYLPHDMTKVRHQLPEVEIVAIQKKKKEENTSFEVDSEIVQLMAIPLIISQVDSPVFGPADVVGIVVALVILDYYYGPSTTTIGMYDKFSRRQRSSESDYAEEAEHTKSRPSTEEKHEKGQSRKGRDKGGEKGDKRRTRYK